MKAKLILDMPESCLKCRYNIGQGGVIHCLHNDKRMKEDDLYGFRYPEWCPLEPIESEVK